jgi:hypothetical protein
MIDLLTKPEGEVTVTDAVGQNHLLPSFPQLQKDVTSLVDDLTGAVSQTRTLVSQAANYAADAQQSAIAAEASATSIAGDTDKAAASALKAEQQATNAKASADAAAASEVSAKASKESAEASKSAAAASQDNAGFSAAAAKNYRDDAQLARDLASAYANAPVNAEVSPGQFSAYHWAEQARLIASGALVYKGSWDASGGTLPPSPKLGDFHFISATGVVGGVRYAVGDMIVYDGSSWGRIDNQQAVTTVAGRTGAVTLSVADIANLQAALDAKASVSGASFSGQVNISAQAPLRFSGFDANSGTVYLHGQQGAGDDIGSIKRVDVSKYAVSFNGTVAATGNISVGGNNVWHSGIFDPGSKATLNADVSFRDITASRGDASGVVWLGNQSQGGRYVFYNGAEYQMPGANLWVAGHFRSGNGYFVTDQGHAVLSNNGSAGIVYLRPNGPNNSSGESRVHSNGDMYVAAWVYANNFKLNSDRRLKENAAVLSPREALEGLKLLVARSYDMGGKRRYGVFADELRTVYPDMVDEGEGPAGPDSLTVSYIDLIAPIVASIQHLDARMTSAGI